MGNSLQLPCLCQCQHDADGTAAGTKKRRRKQKSRPGRHRNVRAAAWPRHVMPVADTPPPPEDGDGGEEEAAGEGFKEAWRPGCRVEPASGCGKDGGGVRRVKIVMRRKDIAELVARLEQRDAAERNTTTMTEVELSASNDGGRVTMSPCRDAWRPRLSIIPENY